MGATSAVGRSRLGSFRRRLFFRTALEEVGPFLRDAAFFLEDLEDLVDLEDFDDLEDFGFVRNFRLPRCFPLRDSFANVAPFGTGDIIEAPCMVVKDKDSLKLR
jgi:hypothetical protein